MKESIIVPKFFVNGHLLGERPSGYASFLYDLTPWLKANEDNVISVRVDHSRQNDSRWYTGSGIYRPVWLVKAPDVHLALWGTAWRVKSLSSKGANVEIDVEVTKGETAIKDHYSAVVDIVDINGKSVASSRIGISAGEKKTVELKIPTPHVWTLNSPYLYKIVTTLHDGMKETDCSEVPLCLRTLTFSPDCGFALNGEWMKVKGVCLHEDAGVLGTAVPADVWRKRLLALKAIGVNAIRMSHNPHLPALYSLCDSLGLLVMDEASDEWEFPKRKWLKGWNRGTPGFEGTFDYFDEWIDRDVADMVRRDRCHPSIFLWSIGNEVDYPNDPYTHPVLDGSSITQPMYGGFQPNQPRAERIGDIAKRLSAVVRGIDSSRAVTGALAGVVMSNETAYPEAVDVVGYNYTESRYGEDHLKYPKRVIYGSENRHDLSSWKAVRDNDHIFGQFLWTGVDYLGESGPWPARGSEAGILDLAGFVKPNGHYRASLWSDTPVCYIGTYANRRSLHGRGNDRRQDNASPYAPALWNYDDGQCVRVVCYTNAPSARLILNGQPLADKPLRDKSTDILYWDIDYEPGTLLCEAIDGDNVVAAYSIQTSGRPYALRATSDKTVLSQKGDVAVVTVEVVDEQGIVVPLADNEVTCRILPGEDTVASVGRQAGRQDKNGFRLLGMENGNMRDTRDKTQPRCRVHNGRLVVYVQCSGTEARKAMIHFSSPMLQGTIVALN